MSRDRSNFSDFEKFKRIGGGFDQEYDRDSQDEDESQKPWAFGKTYSSEEQDLDDEFDTSGASSTENYPYDEEIESRTSGSWDEEAGLGNLSTISPSKRQAGAKRGRSKGTTKATAKRKKAATTTRKKTQKLATGTRKKATKRATTGTRKSGE